MLVAWTAALAMLLLPATAPAQGTGEDPRIKTSVNATRGFYKALQQIKLTYRVIHDRPVTARIELVRTADGRVKRTWTRSGIDSDAEHHVTWSGVIDGRVARDAEWRFRVTAEEETSASGSGPRTATARSDRFDFYRNFFPVRGSHDYGGAGSRFGAPRSGHSHQGQDVMADCGTRLVAARGGKVQARQYHDAAGHYLVIDGAKTEVDYVYMHLKDRSPFGEGERVHTREKIGEVGQSGNATGCHLHFELWKGPGWYEGGDPYDPLPDLKYWDSYS